MYRWLNCQKSQVKSLGYSLENLKDDLFVFVAVQGVNRLKMSRNEIIRKDFYSL